MMTNYQRAQQKIAEAEQAIKEAKTRKELAGAREDLEFWENKAAYYWWEENQQVGAA